MSKKDVLVMFGGITAEHEVSIITGLQVVERINREKYQPHVVYVTVKGEFRYFPKLENRKGFDRNGGNAINWGRGTDGGYILEAGLMKKKIYPEAAYLAFHGGSGENGVQQGLLDALGIPATSPTLESMALTMNKALTREVLLQHELPLVRGVSFSSRQIRANVDEVMAEVEKQLGKQVIIKPAHSGSSIGINIAKTPEDLRQFLQAAALIDSEVLVEELLQNFTEYNCAVRMIEGKIEASEIERPVSQDEILSFADKYQRGGKKTGGEGGMASLDRELPAKIDTKLRDKLQSLAKQVFQACRAKGMVRIDFMVTKDAEIYVTEVNSIPGSMSYYLWEASGYSFTEQITDLIEQAILDYRELSGFQLQHESDIVEKFVKANS